MTESKGFFIFDYPDVKCYGWEYSESGPGSISIVWDSVENINVKMYIILHVVAHVAKISAWIDSAIYVEKIVSFVVLAVLVRTVKSLQQMVQEPMMILNPQVVRIVPLKILTFLVPTSKGQEPPLAESNSEDELD